MSGIPQGLHCIRVDILLGDEVVSSHAFFGRNREEVLLRYKEHLTRPFFLRDNLKARTLAETWMCCDDCNRRRETEVEVVIEPERCQTCGEEIHHAVP